MLKIFSKLKSNSGYAAKSRLKSVISSDRLNTNDNKTLEKIRKEVTEVLERYSLESNSVSVYVCGCKEAGYSLTAKVAGRAAL